MEINPNLRYCEYAYTCKNKYKEVSDCYLGWEPERFINEYKDGGLNCGGVFCRNISGFELIVKIENMKEENK